MQVIRDFLTEHFITDTTFALGVSGGADSLALALMFKQEFPDYRLVALTVDHQLRPTSAQEAKYVGTIMQQYGIEHHILHWEGYKPKTGIEEHARDARYKLLCDWCKTNHCSTLVIAHHLYDQAETFLMRLQRGSGLYGLAAMGGISVKNGIKILRPLLNTHPQQLKDFLTQQKIKWVEDESNQDTDLLRVRIRQFLPLLEQATGITPFRICEAAADLQKTKTFFTDTLQEIMQTVVHSWNDCAYSLNFTIFMSWHKELQFYFLREILHRLSNEEYFLDAESIQNALYKIYSDKFCSLTLGKCFILKEDLKLWFIREVRNQNLNYTHADWDDYVRQTPACRGIKIPYKLKQVLLGLNLLQKK